MGKLREATESRQAIRAADAASWRIADVVAKLRALRESSLAARHRVDSPTKLPARASLMSVVTGLNAALFPNRLADRELSPGSIDYFVGHTLDIALGELAQQVFRELQFTSEQQSSAVDQQRRADLIVGAFANRLPDIRELLETDLRAAYEGDPAARTIDEILACYPGVTAIIHYRLAHALHQLGAPLVARIISEIAHSHTGIDIHPGARINGGFFIDHGTGVVIGETAVIGKRVRIYQAVTLGAKSFPIDEGGTLVKGAARHPVVEDDVVIYAGATILGRITIGRGSVIGGATWLTKSIPPGSFISQAKFRSESFDAGSGI